MRRDTHVDAGLALFLVLSSLSIPMASAQSRAEARRIATQIHDREQYAEGVQIRGEDGRLESFPPGAGTTDGEAEGGRGYATGQGLDGYEERVESDGRRGSPPSTFPSFQLPTVAGEWLALLLKGLALLALFGLVVAIVLAVLRRTAPIASPRSNPSPEPPAPDAEALPWDAGDPDSLFAEGRLGEAILALLVQSLRASGWSPETQRARTAREVCGALSKEDARRAPLKAVVRGAERVRFAGDPPSAQLFLELSRHRDALRSADSERSP
jgi:hypothetical protein